LIDERLEDSRRDERFDSVVEDWSKSASTSLRSFRAALLEVSQSLESGLNHELAKKKLDAVTNDLLALETSLPTEQLATNEPAAVDLGDMLLKVARDRDMKLPQNCSFEIELGRQVPPVSISERNVSRLLSELIACSCEVLNDRSNARLTVRTGASELNLSDLALMANGEGRTAGEYSYLEIEDNGTRFSLRAFKEALSSDEESSLSLALRVGFKSGATIDLARRAGERTSLRIYFPVASEDADAERLEETVVGKALVAEDETSLHPMIEAVVASLGFEAVLETDGCAALKRFSDDPEAFRVAILDVNLPGCGGDRLYDMLAECNKGPVPTVFMSGDPEDAELARAGCSGPVRALAKPYGMAELKTAILELMSAQNLVVA